MRKRHGSAAWHRRRLKRRWVCRGVGWVRNIAVQCWWPDGTEACLCIAGGVSAAGAAASINPHRALRRQTDAACLDKPTSQPPSLLQERRRHEEELEANNGVFYRASLTAVPAPESIAADKGIRRAADKVRPVGGWLGAALHSGGLLGDALWQGPTAEHARLMQRTWRATACSAPMPPACMLSESGNTALPCRSTPYFLRSCCRHQRAPASCSRTPTRMGPCFSGWKPRPAASRTPACWSSRPLRALWPCRSRWGAAALMPACTLCNRLPPDDNGYGASSHAFSVSCSRRLLSSGLVYALLPARRSFAACGAPTPQRRSAPAA